MTMPIRPQTRTDCMGAGAYGAGKWKPGEKPVGGFQGVYASFNDRDCRNSGTTIPEPSHRVIRGK